jgi:hypothetical protein
MLTFAQYWQNISPSPTDSCFRTEDSSKSRRVSKIDHFPDVKRLMM